MPNPPTQPPATSAKPSGNPLTRKLGPAPVYVWLVAAVVVYVGYRHFAGTTTASAATGTTGTASGDTAGTTNGSGSASDTGASGGGGATALDSLPGDLIAELFGSSQQVNSNLTEALVNTTSAIEGLGSEALAQNGNLEQAIIASYTPSPTQPAPALAPATVAPLAPAAPFTPSMPSNASAAPDPLPVLPFVENTPSPVPIYPEIAAAFAAATGSYPSSAEHVQTQATGGPSGAGSVRQGKAATNFQAKRNAL